MKSQFRFVGLLIKVYEYPSWALAPCPLRKVNDRYTQIHRLRTPNEGLNQSNLCLCGRQNMLQSYLKIWDWDLIFGRAVKVISSLGISSQ